MLQVCLSVRYEMKTYTVLIYISRILAVYEVLLCNEIVETKSNMKRTVIQYVAPGPDEKDANVYFLPQKNSSELKFVLQFTVTFP